MTSHQYSFQTRWQVQARPQDVSDVLSDPLDLPRWWPQVYLDVQETGPGVYRLYTKGWLPYRLTWFLRQTANRAPYGFSLEAWGDLTGAGHWTFEPEGAFTRITYLWNVQADKPLLRRFSWLLKPLFAANHRWAMARGLESLCRELEQRRTSITPSGAPAAEERDSGPSWNSSMPRSGRR